MKERGGGFGTAKIAEGQEEPVLVEGTWLLSISGAFVAPSAALVAPGAVVAPCMSACLCVRAVGAKQGGRGHSKINNIQRKD